MPARPKVTAPQIISATRRLLEEKGREGFSMSDVAAAVGVRAPSLYGHFKDRAALLVEVELSLLTELAKALARVSTEQPIESLRAQARAYRRFARKNPNGYALMFDVGSTNTERGQRARSEALAPALAALSVLVGEKDALLAARVLAPFMHGFVSMENARAFRMGPGVEQAFQHGVEAILRGLARGAWPAESSQGSESQK